MRNYTTFIILFLAISLVIPKAKAQVTATVTVENQLVTGTDLFFDIYIKTTAGSSSDLYLDNADFVLDFNEANFTSPTLSKVPNPSPPLGFIQNGYNTFVSTTNTVPTEAATQSVVQTGYYDNTSTEIKSDFLLINLDGVKPTDQSAFDTKMAVIDGTASTHRLGRFKLSGISDSSGTSGLEWVNCALGFSTKLFSAETTSPYGSTQVVCTDVTTPTPVDLLLPLELASFTARKQDETALLDWATSLELNTDYFNVERSADAENWLPIGQVQAAGHSQLTQKYQYVDRNPLAGINYYRLRMVDQDGSFEYSNIEAVQMEDRSETGIVLSPNPTTTVLSIKLNDTTLQAQKISIQNVAGQLLIQQDINGAAFVELPVENLPVGVYILTVSGEKKVVSERFVKQ